MPAPTRLSPLPALSTFDSDTAFLRPAQLPLWDRESARLEILAHEIVRYSPELAEMLLDASMNKMGAELEYA